MVPALQICLFGRFSLHHAGFDDRVISIAARKARALMAYLALQPPGPVSRTTLADLLWGDRVDRQARQSLRQCLVTLRRDCFEAAPTLLTVEPDSVALNRSIVQIDAADFTRAAAGAELADLRRAAELYRGELLPGAECGIEPFDDWLRGERERFAIAAAAVLQACAERHDADDSGAPAIGYAERLVGLDRFREDWHRLLLRLIARHRGREAALARAKQLADDLQRDLGVRPDAETVALIAAIRNRALSPDPAVPAARPAAPPPTPPNLERRVHATASGVVPSAARRKHRLAAATGLMAAAAAASIFALHDPTPAKLALPGAAAPTPQPARVSPVDAGLAHVIVLPFAAASADASDRRLADAFTDDLVTLLEGIPRFKVAARPMAALYRGQAADMAALRRDFGIRYAIEGSVRRDGDSVIANVRIINARTGMQAWSKSFVQPATAANGPNSDLLLGVGRQLHLAIFDIDASDLAAVNGPDDTATLVARAHALTMRATTRADREHIRTMLEEVLRREPNHASAVLTLIYALVELVTEYQSVQPEQDLARAEELLRRAANLAPRTSVRHNFQGRILKFKGEYAAALAEFERAVERNPSHASSHANIGHVLIYLGRVSEGMAAVQKAVRLSPNDPSLTSWLSHLGDAELQQGRLAAALDHYRRAVEKRPHNSRAHLRLSAAYLLADDRASAARHLAEARRLVPAAQFAAIERDYGDRFDPLRKHRLAIDQGIAAVLKLPR